MVERTQVESLNLNLPINTETLLLVDNALNWVERNTSIAVDRANLSNCPATVQLFMLKYVGIMQLPDGISSESAGGLSQSFNNADKDEMLLKIASSIFGDDMMTAGKVTFAAAQRVWA